MEYQGTPAMQQIQFLVHMIDFEVYTYDRQFAPTVNGDTSFPLRIGQMIRSCRASRHLPF